MHLKSTEQFADLMRCNSVAAWRDLIFKLSKELGYEQTVLAIFPDRNAPIEIGHAFLHSNYPTEWRNKYDTGKLQDIDPVVSHCANKSLPLVWTSEIFSARKQREMYEEACSYGIRSGVTLPIHGTRGELGILCFVSDAKPDKRFQRNAHGILPELSYLRDFIFETSRQFMEPSKLPVPAKSLPITPRELECIKWCAAGKSSWDIAQILHCSVDTVNFHFKNLRRKLSVKSRQQVVIKAMRYGLIQP